MYVFGDNEYQDLVEYLHPNKRSLTYEIYNIEQKEDNFVVSGDDCHLFSLHTLRTLSS